MASITVLSIVAGLWPLVGVAVTWLPLLAVPAAAGLPHLIPALSIAPLGDTTWTFWAIDIAGALFMLITAYVCLRATESRRRSPSRGRAFGAAVGVTVLSVIAGNVVRTVAASFIVQSDFGTFIGTTVATIGVSALLGTALGVVVGLVGALATESSTRR